MNAGAVRRLEAPFGRHEESWSLASADVLVVQVTETTPTGVSGSARLAYRRVPRPSSASGATLIDNGDARSGRRFWSRAGEADVEPCGGDACFVVRNGGSLTQTILLPDDVDGKFVVVVGSGSTERINPDGIITGLPTLYGTIGSRDGVRILGYLTQQQMAGRPSTINEWVPMSGVFRMPPDSDRVSLRLGQASARGTPHNGSAARFDDVGVFVFATEGQARSFVASWRGR